MSVNRHKITQVRGYGPGGGCIQAITLCDIYKWQVKPSWIFPSSFCCPEKRNILERFKLRISQKKKNEPIKTAHKILMDNKLRETTNSCVEIWWIVGDKQRENLATWYKSRLPFDLNVMLNLPSIKPQVTVVQASCHLPTCILMRRLDCSLAKCPAHG